MSYDEILNETLTLAEALTLLGVELPEQSRAAIATKDALTAVIHGEDPVTTFAYEIQTGGVTPADAKARALEVLDELARREHVSRLAVAMLLPHSRAIRNPIVAEHEGMLDQLRGRFADAAKALTKAKDIPVDLTAEQAVELDTKRLDLWREIPKAAGQMDGIAAAVLHLARLDDKTKHVPAFCWFVADSDESPGAATVYAEPGTRGAPWHHIAGKGHTLRLATVDEAVNASARHANRAAKWEQTEAERATILARTPLEQSRLDRDRELLARVR